MEEYAEVTDAVSTLPNCAFKREFVTWTFFMLNTDEAAVMRLDSGHLLVCSLPLGRGRRGPARVFFFSSRRRHTRCSRDWSSDVCSSDLGFLSFHSHAAKHLNQLGEMLF